MVTAQFGTCPRFTREEEAALARRAKAGDAEAREQLILSVLPWAMACIGKRAKGVLANDDVVSLAGEAAIEAVDTFRSSRGRLTTHVAWRCRHAWGAAAHTEHRLRRGIVGSLSDELFRAVAMHAASTDRPADEAAARIDEAEAVARVERAAMRVLTPREWSIVLMRAHGLTLAEVADDFGVCKERIRQIQARSQRLLQEALGIRTPPSG